jgi:putative peptidoglycan lipid II flippase
MVSALIKIISKKVDGIKQAAFFIGFFVLLSQILALVRDRLLAFYIGPGETLDIYYAAFRIPDILFCYGCVFDFCCISRAALY